MSIEAKYASPKTRNTNNSSENLSGKPQDLERNVFGKFTASQSNSKLGKNKMAAMKCESDNEEIPRNKRVRKQIVGNVKDDRTGSMMPVILEQMVDGTKSKKTDRKVSNMLGMAGAGTNVLDLSMESQNNTEHNVVGKMKKGRTQRSQNKKQAAKIDSDLEIVAEISSDSDSQKFEKKTKQNKKFKTD